MKVFYDSAAGNQVQAIYSDDTSSTVWAAFSSIEVTDTARISELQTLAPNCQLTIVSGEVTAVTENQPQAALRTALRRRVAAEYDKWVEAGVPVVGLSWTGDTLIILPRDVELLTGVLAIGGSMRARGVITQDTAVLLGVYKFGDGLVKTAVQHAQLEELNSTYQAIRAARFLAHLNVKGGIDAGAMPAQADYEAIDLVSADFDGLGLV